MAGWFSLQTPTPPALAEAGSVVSGGLHAVKGAIEAARIAASTATTSLTSGTPPSVVAFNALVQQAVNAATSAVDGLLDDAGLYTLLVPLPKKGLVELVPEERGAGSTFLESPAANMLKEPTTRDADAVAATPVWQLAFDPDMVFLGGNAWFLRQLSESLHDPGDDGRPRFEPNSAWAYTLLVTGAEDVTAVMSAATYFARLVGLGKSAHDLPPDRSAASLVPQHVRAAPSSRAHTAVITWDLAPVSTILGSFDNASVVATHYAVIRSTDFRARMATKVTDLFSGTLREGLTGAYGSKVVKLAAFDGVTARWADPGPLEEGKDYYYHVAYRTELRPVDDAQRVDQGFVELSSCSHIRLDSGGRVSPKSNGNPPDWVRTPSVAQTIPAVGDLIDKIKEYIRSFATSVNSTSEYDRTFIDFLSREADRYAAKADELTRYLDRVAAVSVMPSAGVAAYVGQGTGGVGAFLGDVAKALADTEDENRPQFDNGSEYVTGLIILAVGPDPAAVAKAFAAFDLFFGTPEGDPVLAGIQSVNAQLAEQEAALTTELSAPTAFDASMNPTTGPDAGCRPT